MPQANPDREPIHVDLGHAIKRWRYTCSNEHNIGEINAYSESYYYPSCRKTHGIDTTTHRVVIDQRSNEGIQFKYFQVTPSK